ncbi:hypothetical protein J8L88_20735 [Aquimarina sp. MMG015]|nr:hypothetical protein [Aquimarina sp. MMG015]AXT55861.1 hypothetical protein D1815_08890 [Aquimarina sp. AD1]MBQ4805300.1 hypothetical protein [Aquimarina sp. MMG015]
MLNHKENMEAILRLQDFRFIKTNKNWFDETAYLSSIIKVIENTNFRSRLKCFYRFKDDRIITLNTFDELKNHIIRCKYDTYVIQDSDSENNSLRLYFEINEFGFSIILFENIEQTKELKQIVQSMIDFTNDIYSVVSGEFLFGYRLGVELYEVKGYIADQARINDYWECNKIADFLSLNYHKTSDVGMPQDYQIFSDFNFPSNVVKLANEDLLIINWGNAINNEEEIGNSMKYRDEWIHNNLN